MNMDLQRIWRQLSADKRKLGLMAALLGFALLLWGRLLLKDVPRTANATPATVAAQAAARTADARAVTDNTTVDRPVVFIYLTDEVERDLFRFNRSFYSDPANGEGNTTTVAKSTSNSTDDSGQRREAEAAVRAAAGTLVLKSTLLGPQPRAVINGVLLAPGEPISGFTLKEVRSRAVTITRDGFEIVLEM